MILFKNKNLTLFFLLFISQVNCFAEINLPHIIADNMVLQQNSKVKLWGKSKPNAIVHVKVGWEHREIETVSDSDGNWIVRVETPSADNKTYAIVITCNSEVKKIENILLGEVWICSGQSNMAMPLQGYPSQPVNGSLESILDSENYHMIRMFTAQRKGAIIAQEDVKGYWEEASINTASHFSAVGYFYAIELYKVLNVPIGLINISWGGSKIQAWMSEESLKKIPMYNDFHIDTIPQTPPAQTATMLYNGMFYPISKYDIKGVIWYQGESNLDDASLYREMFHRMVQGWRKDVGLGEIPFYYVQIAPYKYEDSNGIRSAIMREIQQESLKTIPNSGMVVTIDLGSENNIHPPEKQIISKRLAYISLAQTYGYDKLPHLSPVYVSKEIKNNKIILTFENVSNGLISTSYDLKGFEIADKMQCFVKANAKIIKPNQIEVWSDDIFNPAEVRYCFKNYANGSLFNSFGFPASSFRTDILSY